MLSVELKKYLISSRIGEDEERPKDYGKTAARGTPTSNRQHTAVDDTASKKRSPDALQSDNSKKLNSGEGIMAVKPSAAEIAENKALESAKQALDEVEEEAHAKRMKVGRMDMFCKKENRPNLFSKAKKHPIDSEAAMALELAIQMKKAGNNIRYKFNQGYSNAVRRSVTISDFF